MRGYDELLTADAAVDEKSPDNEGVDRFWEGHDCDPYAVALIAQEKAQAGVTDYERSRDLLGTLAACFLMGLALGLELGEES